jgi:hypothetical protein
MISKRWIAASLSAEKTAISILLVTSIGIASETVVGCVMRVAGDGQENG